jgi:hypothetical protein
MKQNAPGIKFIEIPNMVSDFETNKFVNNYTGFDGPYVNVDSLKQAFGFIGAYDTPYNRRMLENAAIKIFYYNGSNKISFTYKVDKWYPIETDNNDELDKYVYSISLESITCDYGSAWYDTKHFSMCAENEAKDYEFIIECTYWRIKDLVFMTDVIAAYHFGHNKYNLPDKWYIDKDFVEKLFTEHNKLEEIKDDFK